MTMADLPCQTYRLGSIVHDLGLAASVSPIGDLLSHTAKNQSKATYEWVMDTLREIDFSWHMGGE